MAFIIALLATLCPLSMMAADTNSEARSVLDKASSKLQNAGGITLRFTATTLVGKTPQGSTSGTIDIQGKKFCFSTPDMLSWFDGTTQWSMFPGDTECNMTQPTAEEQQQMNPYFFLSIYKKGFTFKMTKGTLSNGSQGYRIIAKATNKKASISEMFIEIDNSFTPTRVSLKQGKNWLRLVVDKYQGGRKFSADHFAFPRSKYPNVEIIDLR